MISFGSKQNQTWNPILAEQNPAMCGFNVLKMAGPELAKKHVGLTLGEREASRKKQKKKTTGPVIPHFSPVFLGCLFSDPLNV